MFCWSGRIVFSSGSCYVLRSIAACAVGVGGEFCQRPWRSQAELHFEVLIDYVFEVTFARLFDVVLHFGVQALVVVDVPFLLCLTCLLMRSLFSSDGLPDGGVYAGIQGLLYRAAVVLKDLTTKVNSFDDLNKNRLFYLIDC